MAYQDTFTETTFINKSQQAAGTPDISSQFLNGFQAAVKAISEDLETTSTLAESLQAAVNSIGTPYTDPTFLTGLKVEYVSATQYRVTSGACYIPSTQSIVGQNSAATRTPTGLVANTMYYVYAQNVNGSIVFSESTTAPVAYLGGAKQMSGDSSRRYIGEFKTDLGTTAIVRFTESNGFVTYQWSSPVWAPTLNIVSGGSNITGGAPELVTIGDKVPVGCKHVYITGASYSDFNLYLSSDDNGISVSGNTYEHFIEHGTNNDEASFALWFPLNTNRRIRYRYDNTPADVYMGVSGYTRER